MALWGRQRDKVTWGAWRQVSSSPCLCSLTAVKMALGLPPRSTVCVFYKNKEWNEVAHFSRNSSEIPNVSLEISVRSNEKWSKARNGHLRQRRLMSHLVSACPLRTSVWTLATVQKSQCILAAACSLPPSSWPRSGLRTRRLSSACWWRYDARFLSAPYGDI